MNNNSTPQKSKEKPRALAFKVLTQVLSEQHPLDEALEDLAKNETSENRAWLLDLCSGTMRWRGRIDFIIDSLATKKKPSGGLRKALQLATSQLLTQDRVSASKVVFETVDFIRERDGDKAAQFANAILRRISEKVDFWKTWNFPESGSITEKSAWASLPEWMWNKLVASWGEAWVRDYALASLERPQTWVRKKDPAEPPQLAQPGLISTQEGFPQGEWIVQDISSQALILEVTNELKARGMPPGHALDLCAAPGGKTVGLAWRGWKVTASDKQGPRMALLQETVARTCANAVEIISAEQLGEPNLKFDLVWVDAPCSGSGILRRHPDVRWLRQEKDLIGLKKSQKELLARGYAFVRPGGFLLYSVCSVFKEEGLNQIEAQGFKPLKTWILAPHLSGGDGFWAALVQKS